MPPFDFSKNYTLENDRVRLSPLQLEHIDALSILSENAEIWMYFLEKGQGKTALTNYITEAIQKRKENSEYPFVIFDKKTHQFAGITRFYSYDAALKIIKLGHTWYGREFWGTGLNTQTKYLLFQFAFETLQLERIGFGVHAENLRSIAALKKIGVQEEGVLRNFLYSIEGNKRVHLHLFSILREEWENQSKT